jgi:hypothetical protein
MGRIDQLRARFTGWENRAVDRFKHWPVGRRWVVFVLLPCMVICCGGAVVGIPLTWFVNETVKAGRGAVSPDAAVDTYLLALGYGREDGLLNVLEDHQGAQLLAQWRAYRAEMQRGDNAPSQLQHQFVGTTSTDADHAVVDVEVYPVWSPKNGGATSLHGSRHPWKFTTREDGGWQVASVEPYPWCGGYVRVDVC